LKQKVTTKQEQYDRWMDRFWSIVSKFKKPEQALREALEHEQFEVVYQPFIDLKTGKVEGLEALIRWNHPSKGIMLPSEFLSTAEQTGLIIPIGRWMLSHVLHQVMLWNKQGSRLTVAFNLSARQLSDPEFLQYLRSALKKYPVASSFELEITESGIMEDIGRNVILLKQLKRMNVSLALDDFGTGY
jgi:EAL domain-containing protein (putative c-di-GMP-specific phosphodiesterase class I)